MKKILIIGKKSFLGSNLKIYLSKYMIVDVYSYEEIISRNLDFFNKYTHIINTAINRNYIKKKYNKKNDFDLSLANKLRNKNIFYIFFNTRKIYLPKQNITENSKIKPIDIYAKNKFRTEVKLKKILKKKLISLRVSNVIGKRVYKNKRNYHKIFIDNFLKFRKYNKKIVVNNDFKDFISISQFCLIIRKIINLKVYGIFNLSISKKIYISEIVKWLDKDFHKKIKFQKSNKDSFTLSNTKLIKKIKIRITKKQLEKFCKMMIYR
tara:strand:- start:429 stop:1223 length:795 start_codon:yes stop_codon:yes gene_type:complete